MSFDKSFAERLTFLEREVFGLQKENLGLKTELFEVQKKNDRLEKKVQVLEEKMAGGPAQDQQALRKNFGDMENRVCALENGVSALESANNRFGSEKESTRIELSALSTKTDRVVTTVGQLCDLKRVLSRTLVASQSGGSVDAKMESLSKRTNEIEKRFDDVQHSVTLVRVNTTNMTLTTGKRIQLDTSYRPVVGDHIDGLYDARRGRVVARKDGRYGVGALWKHKGEGVIDVSLGWTRSSQYVWDLGRTSGNWDTGCGMVVIDLKEGEEVWVAATRLTGDAVIRVCDVFCWLI